jgi:pyruvate dehydrogenase E2 component (dihydrolipoamide acetyltransferase)
LGAYKKPEKLGSFRRFALAFWGPPSDGTIYGTLFCDATNMLALAKKAEEEHGVKITPGHIVGKGVALGLRAVPAFNSKVIWGTIYQKDTVDIYFQVDVEGGKDLSGVLIERADEKSVVEIAKELRDKAQSLRAGKDKQYEKTQKGVLSWLPSFLIRRIINFLTFMEFNLGIPLTFLPGVKRDAFGTAMISNVGSFGIDIAYAPLIPVSRVGLITLVGRITDEPMVVDGKVEVRPRLTGSATFDHRLGNGAQIGTLVRTVRAYMENPYV